VGFRSEAGTAAAVGRVVVAAVDGHQPRQVPDHRHEAEREPGKAQRLHAVLLVPWVTAQGGLIITTAAEVTPTASEIATATAEVPAAAKIATTAKITPTAEVTAAPSVATPPGGAAATEVPAAAEIAPAAGGAAAGGAAAAAPHLSGA